MGAQNYNWQLVYRGSWLRRNASIKDKDHGLLWIQKSAFDFRNVELGNDNFLFVD